MRTPRRRIGWVALALVGCEPDPRAVFDRDVLPELERSCASSLCHGVGPGAEAAGEDVDWSMLFFHVDERDRITDPDQAYEAAKRAIVTDEAPEHSTLLRKPLATAHGGLPHYGGESWPSPDDPAYRALRAWIALESGGGEDVPPLDAREQRFADEIQPVLAGMSCMGGACHGPSTGVPFRFDPGVHVEADDGTRAVGFSRAATRANLAATETMLSLDGDPLQSRLLRKMLPLWEGGIVHKGGNRAFLTGPDDPRAQAIVDWACDERLAATGSPCETDRDGVPGVVFVRGPLAPEDPFTLDQFTPGTDLFLAVDGAVANLTAALHEAPADVRDPTVDPTGTKVAFAMRTGEERGHELWVIDLGTREAERITSSAPLPDGGWSTDRDPTWGPDGIWFVSTRAGVVADRGDRLDADLYQLVDGEIVRRSFTPHVERKPVFFVHGEEAGGEVGFSSLRDAIPAQARAHPFRFPPGLETEYHQHFGITPPETSFFDVRELPDGRYVAVVGELGDVWGGRLAIVDRNFGPELLDGEPGVPVYAPPLARLDPEAAIAGTPGRLYRDPVALPDGSLLAAVAEGVDPADPDAVPDLGVVRIVLSESPDGSGAVIAERIAVVDEPGVADFDPEPVFVRGPVPETPMRWDPAAETALLRHQGYETIDALLANLPPGGEKRLRDDVVAVRIVEHVPLGPAARRPIPADETLHGVAGATTTSLGAHGPSRILAEVPLADDGTFQIELPAGTAVRLQGLDARGMAVGTMHNRWFDLHPGQTLAQGVPPGAYRTSCAVCHGAQDGDPAEVYPEPDVLTSASLTLARFDDQDPRRPIDPLPVPTRTSVDFRADVRPILDRRCTGCHAGDAPAGGLDLSDEPTVHFDVGYENLLAPGLGSVGGRAYVDEADGSARQSWLVEILVGEELDAPGTVSGGPHGDLDPDELLTVIRWIELGATWTGGGP